MSVTFRIPSYLASFAGNSNSVSLHGSPLTVQDALAALWERCPALRDRIVDEQGQVRQHVNIFVGNESIRFANGMETPVSDGTEILIVPAVSGG